MNGDNYNAVTPSLGSRKNTGDRASKKRKSKGVGKIPRDNEVHGGYDDINGVGIDGMSRHNEGLSTSGATDTNSSTASTNTSNTTNTIPDQRWPDSLEQFVSNSFTESNRLDDIGKVSFHEQIKYLVEKAQSENKLFINDWNDQKVPILSNGPCPLELVCDLDTSNSQHESPKKQKRSRVTQQDKKTDYDSEERKKQRMNRFSTPEPQTINEGPGSTIPSLPSKPNFVPGRGPQSDVNDDPVNLIKPIVGRSLVLEKRYYRLTSEPDPALVRPQEVLEKAVKVLLTKLNIKPYSYIKDQLKAIRQDMTVQHIKNDFSMYVYETNARIAIENNDLGEMNQCLTQLEYFFDKKSVKTNHLNRIELEFNCYRILYMLMVQNHSEIFKLKYKILKRNYQTPDELMNLKYVNLAFELQRSMISGNYYKFFKQAEEFKPMKLAYKLIKDFLMEKERIKSLNIITKSYRKLSIQVIKHQLNINQEEFEPFLHKFKLNAFITNDEFDCVNARSYVNNFIINTNFKRIDIKGQV